MLEHLQTEARNPASARLDELTSIEIVSLMNREDATIAAVVATQASEIARGIDAIADRLTRGGRLIYCGAGTSGRLGVLDASECPPTFQTDPSQVVGLIAGGERAMFRAVEGAEDSPELGANDLRDIALSANDVVCVASQRVAARRTSSAQFGTRAASVRSPLPSSVRRIPNSLRKSNS